MTAQPEEPRQLADIGDEPDSGERISVTDVNGTVARFEMSYTPPAGERLVFRPPRTAYALPAVYLTFALTLVALVALAYSGSSNSRLYVWIVEGDRGRPLPAALLAGIVLVSALGTMLRTHLRGVIVRADGIEARYLVALGLPRVRKWAWAQMHRVIADDEGAMLELWDGTYARLPEVADGARLRATLEGIAAARKIPVTRLR